MAQDPIFKPIPLVPDKPEPGSQIWTRLFHVRVPYRDTLSAEEIRMFGMPTVGDAGIDKAMHDDLVDRWITIDRMVALYQDGARIELATHTDSKLIYDIIHEHLTLWAQRLEGRINVGDAPIEDLVTLDRFAAVMFPHAVRHFADTPSSSSLVRLLQGAAPLSRDNLFSQEADDSAVAPDPLKHTSLEKLFIEGTQSFRNGGSRW